MFLKLDVSYMIVWKYDKFISILIKINQNIWYYLHKALNIIAKIYTVYLDIYIHRYFTTRMECVERTKGGKITCSEQRTSLEDAVVKNPLGIVAGLEGRVWRMKFKP